MADFAASFVISSFVGFLVLFMGMDLPGPDVGLVR
jgi:hypothetical protein